MGDLPTCWYCPECGDGPAPRGFKHLRGDDGSDTICPGTHVKCVVILPGTPLTVILDMLGIEYREGWFSQDDDGTWSAVGYDHIGKPVLVVDNPATNAQ